MKQALNSKLFSLSLFLGIFWANLASAICPLCVVAIGAGLGLSEWLGVDDVVSSIWIGAILVAMILWTIAEMRKKNWSFVFDTVIISLAYYLLTFIPLYYSGILGHPLNKIWGIDKIVFGTIIGTVVSLAGHWLNIHLKNKNNGKVFFPYQKVVVPVVILLIISIIFFILLKWKII
ncbi:MAG: hypothetical protein NTY04_01055 [Candidatus Staskawiczbacteria bacterium]|nr:hypothetical protein [Candidatus Staskawiczbacteria bacterium]